MTGRNILVSKTLSDNSEYDKVFDTIQQAVDEALPGDRILVERGLYPPFEVSKSGTVHDSIRIESLSGEVDVVIDGTSFFGKALVSIVGQSHIGISGFNLKNAPKYGVYVEGSEGVSRGILIENNKVDTTGSSGIHVNGVDMQGLAGVDRYYLEDVIIRGNEVTNTNTPNGVNEAISLGGGVSGFTIEKNYVHNSDQYGIDVKAGAKNGVVSNNLIHNIEFHGIYIDAGSRKIENVLVSENTVYNALNGIVIARESRRDPESPNIENVSVISNSIQDVIDFGILLYRHVDDSGLNKISNVKISSNYIDGAGLDGIRVGNIASFSSGISVMQNTIVNSGGGIWNNSNAILAENETSNLEVHQVSPDIIHGFWNMVGNDLLHGTDGNDTLWSISGDDVIYAGAGNDRINSGTGDDLIYGGDGNDYIASAVGNDEVYAGSGDDLVRAYDGDDSVWAGDGSDRIILESGNDLAFGGLGSDTVECGEGNDSVWGGGGADTIFGDSGKDLIGGGDGADFLYGGSSDDTLIGDDGNDGLYGGDGHDEIRGGSGEDTVYGGTGKDLIFGGAGADLLFGEDGDDRLDGGSENDVIWAGNGADTVLGGEGDDLIGGGSGNDKLFGAEGHDSIQGGDGCDVMFGGDGSDSLNGNAGDDLLEGGGGDDVLTGGLGRDNLDGGLGNDTLRGGEGNDIIVGGLGGDVLWGDSGNDTFVFSSVFDSLFEDSDVIEGFDGAGHELGDVVDLSMIGTRFRERGGETLNFLGEATMQQALDNGAGAVWLENTGFLTRISVIINDDGVVDFSFLIRDGVEVVASSYSSDDFIL